MKFRTPFFIAVTLLIFGIAWFTFSNRNKESAQVFPATINRDCAPWDGSAFTVSIPTNDGIIIHISIWQSPDIKPPVRFSFPDESGQISFAYILPELDPLQQLRGEASFTRVEEGIPVEGEFDLTTASGKQLKGSFKAKWGNQVVYCG
jgi:hypothetical protein